MNITDEIIYVLEEITEQPVDKKAAESSTNLIQDFGLNSLNLMHFIVALEERLDILIELGDVELSMFDSISSIEQYALIQKKNAAS